MKVSKRSRSKVDSRQRGVRIKNSKPFIFSVALTFSLSRFSRLRARALSRSDPEQHLPRCPPSPARAADWRAGEQEKEKKEETERKELERARDGH